MEIATRDLNDILSRDRVLAQSTRTHRSVWQRETFAVGPGDSRADRIGAKGPLKGDEQLKGATRSEAATESEIAERRVSARVREAALLQSERGDRSHSEAEAEAR